MLLTSYQHWDTRCITMLLTWFDSPLQSTILVHSLCLWWICHSLCCSLSEPCFQGKEGSWLCNNPWCLLVCSAFQFAMPVEDQGCWIGFFFRVDFFCHSLWILGRSFCLSLWAQQACQTFAAFRWSLLQLLSQAWSHHLSTVQRPWKLLLCNLLLLLSLLLLQSFLPLSFASSVMLLATFLQTVLWISLPPVSLLKRIKPTRFLLTPRALFLSLLILEHLCRFFSMANLLMLLLILVLRCLSSRKIWCSLFSAAFVYFNPVFWILCSAFSFTDWNLPCDSCGNCKLLYGW